MSLSDPNNQIKPFKGIRSMGRVQTSTSGLNACTGFKHVNKNRTYSTLGWQQVYWSEEPGSNLRVRTYRKYQTKETSSKIGAMSKYVDQRKVLSKWMHPKTTRILWICQMFGLDYCQRPTLNCLIIVPSEFWREAAPRILKACLVLLRSPKLQLFGTLLGLSSPEGSMLGSMLRSACTVGLSATTGTPEPWVTLVATLWPTTVREKKTWANRDQ